MRYAKICRKLMLVLAIFISIGAHGQSREDAADWIAEKLNIYGNDVRFNCVSQGTNCWGTQFKAQTTVVKKDGKLYFGIGIGSVAHQIMGRLVIPLLG